MKFVGRIIMTILFVFICIGAYAGDDLLKYEIEGEDVYKRQVSIHGLLIRPNTLQNRNVHTMVQCKQMGNRDVFW